MGPWSESASKPASEGDRRIVYGASCAWWDYIDKATTLPSGIPCCPHCNGVLFEMDRGEWEEQIEKHTKATNNPTYPVFMTWLKGKCFRNWTQAFEAFKVWRKG